MGMSCGRAIPIAALPTVGCADALWRIRYLRNESGTHSALTLTKVKSKVILDSELFNLVQVGGNKATIYKTSKLEKTILLTFDF